MATLAPPLLLACSSAGSRASTPPAPAQDPPGEVGSPVSSGRTLIADDSDNRVVEVDSQGNEVSRIDGLNSPSDADRLQNGNTLVAENGMVREFDPQGKVVWKLEMTWAVEANRY